MELVITYKAGNISRMNVDGFTAATIFVKEYVDLNKVSKIEYIFESEG